MQNVMRTAAVTIVLGAMPALAMGQQQPDPETMKQGAQLYGQTCARCHNLRSATEHTDRAWGTIMLHMRARANLTKSDAEAIRVFLQATNGDETRTSARDGPALERVGEAQRAASAWRVATGDAPIPFPASLDAATAGALADYLAGLRAGDREP